VSQLRELERIMELSVVIEKAAGIGKNIVQFLPDCLFEVVSGHQEQMSERLKIPTLLTLNFNFH